eukprot:scaffold83097_cov69-Phaeocystis_antarctica.AAC.5
MAVALSLLPVAAVVAAIHTLPMHMAQQLAASAGSCNSPAYVEAYHITSLQLGHVVEGTAAWCDAQTDGCSISSFLSEMGSRVYEQADPARSIGNQVSPQRVPCRADGCAHFDDDSPDLLPPPLHLERVAHGVVPRGAAVSAQYEYGRGAATLRDERAY